MLLKLNKRIIRPTVVSTGIISQHAIFLMTSSLQMTPICVIAVAPAMIDTITICIMSTIS
ncbi:hypothetical protein MBAV_002091 [Candidatus Magnetobacterium bavaricum]|uniref:Uncharacterized protein n=1 Tax=Candidatus Magnetobacterium bavaricum TaxID=29290 RepID=A0A0F3GUZ0_9BACT|nr:hypothetical protein MBAV_002091 [Candidatus Magnetobacterium bavaricum]